MYSLLYRYIFEGCYFGAIMGSAKIKCLWYQLYSIYLKIPFDCKGCQVPIKYNVYNNKISSRDWPLTVLVFCFVNIALFINELYLFELISWHNCIKCILWRNSFEFMLSTIGDLSVFSNLSLMTGFKIGLFWYLSDDLITLSVKGRSDTSSDTMGIHSPIRLLPQGPKTYGSTREP